jgi:hypothetical protein
MALAVVATGPAWACSPPFERPTIAALGPGAVVVVGTVGEPVEGGRLFHVQRAYSGRVAASPIVIAFKEGPGLGDCGYQVVKGTRLLIAAVRDPDGRLPVDLATLQADPTSPDGQRYVAEAEALFGQGSVPTPAPGPTGPDASILVIALAAIAVVVGIGAWRRASRKPS